MAASFEDSVLDFDINLFNPTSNNAVVSTQREKIRKSILFAKKKIVATNSLIKKYYDTRTACRELERLLITSKEECKQVCIENINIQDKHAAAELINQKLQTTNRELDEKCTVLSNRYEGIQSHANQLQVLIRENETQIESLKIENQIVKAHARDFENKYKDACTENDNIIKNMQLIRDIVLGKKKLTNDAKTFLEKFKSVDNGSISDDDVSCMEIEFDDPMSSASDSEECPTNLIQLPCDTDISSTDYKLQSNNKEEILQHKTDDESESSNEVVSLDTGRGSSLAFSDSDKCFNSPDYFIQDSPLGVDTIKNKENKTVDICTSTNTVRELKSVGTSPIVFSDTEPFETISRHDLFNEETNGSKRPFANHVIDNIPVIMIERALSPLPITETLVATKSPLRCKFNETASSPLYLSCNVENKDHSSQQIELLELNDRNILEDDNSSDGEIQMILNKMRFTQKLVTPIPTTPEKSRVTEVHPANTQKTIRVCGIACPDAARVREENLILQATVSKLASDIQNINNILNKLKSLGDTDTRRDSLSVPADANSNASNNVTEKDNDCTINESVVDATDKTSCKVKNSKSEKRRPSLFSDSIFYENKLPSLPEDVLEESFNENSNHLRTSDRLHFEDPLPTPDLLSDNESCEIDNTRQLTIQELTSVNKETFINQESDDLYTHEIHIEIVPDDDDNVNKDSNLVKHQYFEEITEMKGTKKAFKTKKLSKLDKLRKRIIPKSKIKRPEILSKKQLKCKQVKLRKSKLLNSNHTTPPVNNKKAYDFAVKVMADIKSKQKDNNKSMANASLGNVSEESNEKCNGDQTFMRTRSQSKHVEKFDAQNKKCITIAETNFDTRLNLEKISPVSLQHRSIRTRSLSKSFEHDNNNRQIPKKLIQKLSSHKTTDNEPLHNQSPEKHVDSETPRSERCKTTAENDEIVKPKHKETCEKGNSNNLKRLKRTPSPAHTISPKSRRCGKNHDRKDNLTDMLEVDIKNSSQNNDKNIEKSKNIVLPAETKSLKRVSVDESEFISKKVLRSSSVRTPDVTENDDTENLHKPVEDDAVHKQNEIVSYSDLDIFDESPDVEKEYSKKGTGATVKVANTGDPKHSILCSFLDRYGKKSCKPSSLKISENVVSAVCKSIEDGVMEIQKVPAKDIKCALNELVQVLQKWKPKQILSGLLKYLMDPARKIELYNKIIITPAPPMTKTEQILLYVVAQLRSYWPEFDIIDILLKNIEYTLFLINRTPDFDVIDTLSHFYAVLCRYNKDRNRLRIFILDAMYCLQFKAVPLIKQCLDVWMHILPLAHMGTAKSPLVISIVYLLHFYKCEDRFNRVQDIKNILHRKYFYEVTDWNETKILEMFKNSILELRDNKQEKKMLRMSLIIIAKRQGAKWCQKHIIKDMLLPIIDKPSVSASIKQFCISLLGPLLKPYPIEMKVHCEVIMNQLSKILEQNPSHGVEEAAFTSLIYMSKHNHKRVVKALLNWKPQRVSSEFEELLRDFVRERPLKSWKIILSKLCID